MTVSVIDKKVSTTGADSGWTVVQSRKEHKASGKYTVVLRKDRGAAMDRVTDAARTGAAPISTQIRPIRIIRAEEVSTAAAGVDRIARGVVAVEKGRVSWPAATNPARSILQPLKMPQELIDAIEKSDSSKRKITLAESRLLCRDIRLKNFSSALQAVAEAAKEHTLDANVWSELLSNAEHPDRDEWVCVTSDITDLAERKEHESICASIVTSVKAGDLDAARKILNSFINEPSVHDATSFNVLVDEAVDNPVLFDLLKIACTEAIDAGNAEPMIYHILIDMLFRKEYVKGVLDESLVLFLTHCEVFYDSAGYEKQMPGSHVIDLSHFSLGSAVLTIRRFLEIFPTTTILQITFNRAATKSADFLSSSLSRCCAFMLKDWEIEPVNSRDLRLKKVG